MLVEPAGDFLQAAEAVRRFAGAGKLVVFAVEQAHLGGHAVQQKRLQQKCLQQKSLQQKNPL